MTHRLALLFAFLFVGCEARAPKAPAAHEVAATRASEPAASEEPAARAPRHFGEPEKLAGEPLPVEQVMAAPDPHLGKAVKCSGVVARVCQAAGCWLELQAQGGGEGLRVPMANHAFFIPQDAVGQLAVVEGELKRQPLPAAQRDHYASEGMKAMGPLSLDATSVTLR